MRFIRSLKESLSTEVQRELSSESIVGVTIGNFDGMHLGHQALFKSLRDRLQVLAEAEKRKPVHVLLTFIPHPRVYLSGASKRDWLNNPCFWTLNSLSTKIELAQLFGFDYFFRVKFGRHFSSLSPQGFAKLYLVSALHARLVVVGDDFRFGEGRTGAVEQLAQLGEKYGFEVLAEPAVMLDGYRISSSRVKQAVLSGELSGLKRLLGRKFELAGKVGHGDKRGRKLGFPTANIIPRKQLLPPDGVYSSLFHLEGDVKPSVTYIGCRPTFGDSKRRVVESHLLGLEDINLYRKRVRVEFIDRIRGDMKFKRADELCAQMKLDIEIAKHMLQQSGALQKSHGI